MSTTRKTTIGEGTCKLDYRSVVNRVMDRRIQILKSCQRKIFVRQELREHHNEACSINQLSTLHSLTIPKKNNQSMWSFLEERRRAGKVSIIICRPYSPNYHLLSCYGMSWTKNRQKHNNRMFNSFGNTGICKAMIHTKNNVPNELYWYVLFVDAIFF